MDKLKQYLKVAGKHHFWILCGVVAIITLGSWYTSAAKLTTQYNAKKSKINDAEGKATGVAGTADHPNKEYQDELDKVINAYKVSLRELWQKQYDGQGKNLQWPEERPGFRGLTHEFVEQVKDLRPIEIVPFEPEKPDKLKGNYKEQYRDFVKSTELPRLASIIGSTWAPARDGGNNAGRNNSDTKETDIVLWNPSNQDDLENFRFDWSREPTKLPTTLQILYAQEDLWVLGTLINIIAKTNEGADARHNAVVKEIKYLRLGTNAVGLSGEVMRLESAAPAPRAPGVPPVPGPPAAPGGPLMNQPGGVPGAVAAVRDPASDRYVDVDYKPVPPDRLRGASKSNSAADAFLAVAKRMPVRMHLVVDQRYLNRLLAECGNSNLVVEIRQVRLNRPVYEGGAAAGGVAAPRLGGAVGGERGFGFTPPPRTGGGNRGGGGNNGPRRGGGDARGPNGEEIPHHEVDIELYGIVYIYNPVNEAMVTAVADAGAPSPVTAPATPVPTVPVPAVPAPTVPAVPPAGNPAAPMNPVAAPPAGAAVVPPAAPMPMPVPPAAPANK